MRKKTRWCKEAYKALIEKDMSMKDLAAELGIRREYASGIVHGRVSAPEMAEKISNYLDVKVPYDVVRTYPL